MLRLTADVRRQLLEHNEGFTRQTHFEGKNFSESRIYTISGGQLEIREIGKTSWADSRYDNTRIATDEQAHRFLYEHQAQLDESRVELRKSAAAPIAEAPSSVSSDAATDDQPDELDADGYAFPDDPETDAGGEGLTGRELAVVAGIVATLGLAYVTIRYGRPIWTNKIAPAAVRLRERIRARTVRSTGTADEDSAPEG